MANNIGYLTSKKYQCMRTTLMEAINKNCKSVVIPAFGGSVGRVEPDIIAIIQIHNSSQCVIIAILVTNQLQEEVKLEHRD